MGSFLEEIIKGGLGNVFGSSKSDSSGGLEDIMKELQKKMGGASSGSSSKGNSVEDIVRDMQQKMGGGTSDGGGLSDVAREIRRKMGMDTSPSNTESSTSSGSTASDVAKELRKRMGIEEKETSTTQKKTKKAEPASGGMGDIFGKMGIDLGNLGGLAESVLKTIGLAGKSV